MSTLAPLTSCSAIRHARASGPRYASGSRGSASCRRMRPGSHESHGLTLLEAAAVGGETLAAEPWPNAIGAAVTAAPDPDRVAVRDGGVDSAVALLESGPRAIGVHPALWIDPRAPTRAACCSPGGDRRALDVSRARHPARHARSPRGVPAPRRRVLRSRYQAGETPNPCVGANASFRFDELRIAVSTRAGYGRRGELADAWRRSSAPTSIVESGRHAVRCARRREGTASALKHNAHAAPSAGTSSSGLLEICPPSWEPRRPETRTRGVAAGFHRLALDRESQEACFRRRAPRVLVSLRHAPPIVEPEGGARACTGVSLARREHRVSPRAARRGPRTKT